MSGISILKLITIGLEENIQAKAISTINPEKWALATSDIVTILIKATRPLVFIFALIPKSLNKIFRSNDKNSSPSVTKGELRMMIDVGEEEGTVNIDQGEMLENVFRFAETEAKEIMTPRNKIEWVHLETSFSDFLNVYKSHPHSRFPVYDDDYDEMIELDLRSRSTPSIS